MKNIHGKLIPIYFQNEEEICGWCLHLGHRYSNCGAWTAQKSRANCSKCGKAGHPVEVCDAIHSQSSKHMEAQPAGLKEEGDKIFMIGEWKMTKEAVETAIAHMDLKLQ